MASRFRRLTASSPDGPRPNHPHATPDPYNAIKTSITRFPPDGGFPHVFVRLLFLLTLLPLIELVLLTWLSAHTDWRLTVLFVLGTGALGAWLIRWQGWRAWRNIREGLARGEAPAESIQDGLLILVAGLLLITPGVLTDLVGVLLLVPPFRRALGKWLRRRWRARFTVRTFGAAGSPKPGGEPDDTIIDVASTPVDQEDGLPRPSSRW